MGDYTKMESGQIVQASFLFTGLGKELPQFAATYKAWTWTPHDAAPGTNPIGERSATYEVREVGLGTLK
ncbi:unnamed protein product, partial [Amoebophrya sp. A25]|eukprot:GSA25T00015669001.1